MAEPAAKHSVLDVRPLVSPALSLEECTLRGRINLRGDASDPNFIRAVTNIFGTAAPTTPNTSTTGADGTILWLGPDEWLIETAAEAEEVKAGALERALCECHAAVAVVGDAGTTLTLAGPHAVDVLAKGMTLDLDPTRFLPGHCARSLLAKATVLLHRPGDAAAFEITVARSFADYVWRWLEDAALEYTMAET